MNMKILNESIMGINNFHKDVWLKVVKNSTYGTGSISYNWNPFGAIKGTE
jgi:hypothetical protein